MQVLGPHQIPPPFRVRILQQRTSPLSYSSCLITPAVVCVSVACQARDSKICRLLVSLAWPRSALDIQSHHGAPLARRLEGIVVRRGRTPGRLVLYHPAGT